MRKLSSLFVFAILALILTACGGGSAETPSSMDATPIEPEPTQEPVRPSVRFEARFIQLNSFPSTLDPHKMTDAGSHEYAKEIFSGLVKLDENENVVPDIAERWEVSPDGSTITFYLRRDVMFGGDAKGRGIHPVTTGNFKESLERACAPSTGSTTSDTYLGWLAGCKDKLRGKSSEVYGARVIDDYTIALDIVDGIRPSLALNQLTYPTGYVVDMENVRSGGVRWAESPNGTGPFKLVTPLERGMSSIILERNPLYYGKVTFEVDGKVYEFSELEAKTGCKPLRTWENIVSGGSAMILYKTDEIDMVPVGLNEFQQVTDPANPLNKELRSVDEYSVFYIGFNVAKPPFDDPKVRTAFAMALDREVIANTVLQGYVSPATGIVPPGIPGHNPNLAGIPFDPARAKQLLAESRYAGNMPDIKLMFSGGGGAAPTTIQAIQRMWLDNLGIEVELEQTQYSTFLSDLNQRPIPYQLYSMGWIADYADPQNFIDVLFHSESFQNHTGYANPQVNELIERARVEQDETIRNDLYRQAEEIIIADVPWIPSTYGRGFWLVKPHIKGLELHPLSIENMSRVAICLR